MDSLNTQVATDRNASQLRQHENSVRSSYLRVAPPLLSRQSVGADSLEPETVIGRRPPS